MADVIQLPPGHDARRGAPGPRQRSPQSTPGGGHLLAAAIAALVSIGVHGFLAWMATRVDFDFLTRSVYEAPDRRFPALQASIAELVPEQEQQVLETLRQLSSDVASGPDLAGAIDELQKDPDAASLEPPAMEAPEAEPDLASLSAMEMEVPPLDFQPRQEIVAIEDRAVADEVSGLERITIPSVERIPDAPDITLPADRASLRDPSQKSMEGLSPSLSQIMNQGALVTQPSAMDRPSPSNLQARPAGGREMFEESPEMVTDVKAIEDVLKARVATYSDAQDGYRYFQLVVERLGEDVLPVMPKDIILVQDSSASMAEQRLHFCREALRRSLALIRPGDRFNVAKFADGTTFCFPDWVAKTPETVEQAEAFINTMQSTGNTDLFASMTDLLTKARTPGRALIAFVITDGLVNKGITDSSEIIGAFSRQNDGMLSVFAMGVSKLANEYLIDLLSFANKGASRVVTSGRWDIPDEVVAMLQSIRRPVLADLMLRFAVDSSVEAYPVAPGHLYLDRPLVIYGRYRPSEESLVFQALGDAGAIQCDMIFDLPLTGAMTEQGDESIREAWSRQKIYYLIGEFTRSRDRDILRELRQTARDYDQPIPYRRQIGF